MIQIEQLKEASTEAAAAISVLLAQLRENPKEHTATQAELETIVSDPNIVLLVAKDEKKIIGMTSLYIMNKFSKRTGSIEDVVVDDGYRGQGIGQRLVEEIIESAKQMGLKSIQLTSRPERVAGNKLYQKLGFEQKETNVYRMKL
jgi:ribosomal protein S18 acetylase RimI-like enzyme